MTRLIVKPTVQQLAASAAAEAFRDVMAAESIVVCGSETCCSALKMIGDMALSAGAQCGPQRFHLLSDYVGLPPEHDESIYFRVVSALYGWPGLSPMGCVFGVDIDRGRRGGGHASESVCSSPADNVLADIAIVEIGAHGNIGLCYTPHTCTVRTHKDTLPAHIIDARSRFFERYENTPTEARNAGLQLLRGAKTRIICALESTLLTMSECTRLLLESLCNE